MYIHFHLELPWAVLRIIRRYNNNAMISRFGSRGYLISQWKWQDPGSNPDPFSASQAHNHFTSALASFRIIPYRSCSLTANDKMCLFVFYKTDFPLTWRLSATNFVSPKPWSRSQCQGPWCHLKGFS